MKKLLVFCFLSFFISGNLKADNAYNVCVKNTVTCPAPSGGWSTWIGSTKICYGADWNFKDAAAYKFMQCSGGIIEMGYVTSGWGHEINCNSVGNTPIGKVGEVFLKTHGHRGAAGCHDMWLITKTGPAANIELGNMKNFMDVDEIEDAFNALRACLAVLVNIEKEGTYCQITNVGCTGTGAQNFVY